MPGFLRFIRRRCPLVARRWPGTAAVFKVQSFTHPEDTTVTAHPTPQTPRHHLLSLALAALMTAAVLAGLLGLAGADSAAQAAQHTAQMARQAAPANQAAAARTTVPGA